MNNSIITPSSSQSLVEVKKIKGENKIFTNSLIFAKEFEKLHKNILQTIEEIKNSAIGGQLTFQPSYYLNSQNKKQKMYLMDRTTTLFLMSSMTGEKIDKIKFIFIKEFERMEKLIANKVIRTKGDEPAFMVRLQTDILKLKLEEQGLTPEFHHYINSNTAVNEIVFGESGIRKKLRQDMTEEQARKLRQTIYSAISVYVKDGYVKKNELKEKILPKISLCG